MPDFSLGQEKLLGFWGVIQAAVSQRASTADLWASVKNAAAEQGVDIGGASGADMSTLRGYAARLRNAAEAVALAPDTAAVTAAMLPQDVSARSLTDQLLSPTTEIRYHATYNRAGVLYSRWETYVHKAPLPATIAEVLGLAAGAAADRAEESQTELVNVMNVGMALV